MNNLFLTVSGSVACGVVIFASLWPGASFAKNAWKLPLLAGAAYFLIATATFSVLKYQAQSLQMHRRPGVPLRKALALIFLVWPVNAMGAVGCSVIVLAIRAIRRFLSGESEKPRQTR